VEFKTQQIVCNFKKNSANQKKDTIFWLADLNGEIGIVKLNFYTVIENVQLKVTKSNVFSVDLVSFDCCLA
jgi:hypothetical protein